MFKFIDKWWGAWVALGLIVLITLCGWAGGVNNPVAGHSFAGFFDKTAYLIGQGNIGALLCVAFSLLLVVLTVRGWLRAEKKPEPPAGHADPAPPLRPGKQLYSLAYLALLLLQGPAAFLLASVVGVLLAVWLRKRWRAQGNETTGAALGRLTNA